MTPEPTAAEVSAPDLLAAIEDLLHANAAATHSNQGGTWFIDPDGMGTHRLNPAGIIELRERVYAKRKAEGLGWMMPHRSFEDLADA